MPKLNRDQLFAYSAPPSPIGLQQQLVAALRQHFAAADRTCQTLQAQLDEINKLSAALLRQAFGGGF
jgi:hypothetical protein